MARQPHALVFSITQTRVCRRISRSFKPPDADPPIWAFFIVLAASSALCRERVNLCRESENYGKLMRYSSRTGCHCGRNAREPTPQGRGFRAYVADKRLQGLIQHADIGNIMTDCASFTRTKHLLCIPANASQIRLQTTTSIAIVGKMKSRSDDCIFSDY